MVHIGKLDGGPPREGEQRIACNFCGLDMKVAGPLFGGRKDTFICAACVERLHERIVKDRGPQRTSGG